MTQGDSRVSTHPVDAPLTSERITDLARMLDEWAVQRKPALSVGERHILEDAAKGLRELLERPTKADLKPCPFCGGAVTLERTTGQYEKMHGRRDWWGVVCRNTMNLGGTCAIEQRPSASKEAAIERWNRRA